MFEIVVSSGGCRVQEMVRLRHQVIGSGAAYGKV